MPPTAVIAVHGAGGGAWEWARWQRVFAAAGVALEALELEAAARGLEATTLSDYQAQVDAAVGARPGCLLLGASLGALLALCCTGPVGARVLVNPMLPVGVGGRARDWPARVGWSRSALASTQRALPDGDPIDALWAHARWRDESGAVLREAQSATLPGIDARPLLVLQAKADVDLDAWAVRRWALERGGDYVEIPAASHLGPLLGRSAPHCARFALTWWSLQEPQ